LTDADTVQLPALQDLTLRVHFVLACPLAGSSFLSCSAATPRAAHFYTHGGQPGPDGPRLWLPCVDTPTESYPFDFYITCHARCLAVCTGKLQQVVAHGAEDEEDEVPDGSATAPELELAQAPGERQWVLWQATCDRLYNFMEQTGRLPRATRDGDERGVSSALLTVTAAERQLERQLLAVGQRPTHSPKAAARREGELAVAAEAELAGWALLQRRRWVAGALSPLAIAQLQKLPGWEWEPLKTYHYRTWRPVLAAVVCLAAGPFMLLPEPTPSLPAVSHGCLPGVGRLEQLRHTTRHFEELHRFVRELAGEKAVPFGSRPYTQLFVDGLPLCGAGVPRTAFGHGWRGYADVTLLSAELLHGPEDLEAALAARRAMAEALAAHFFGTVIAPRDAGSRWLVVALARYVARKYLAQVYGHTHELHALYLESNEVVASCDDFPALSSALAGGSSSQEVLDFVAKKGTLLLHMVEVRLANGQLREALQQLVIDANSTQAKTRQDARQLTAEAFFSRWIKDAVTDTCIAHPAQLRALLIGGAR
jgi:hypothetical protein